MIRFILKELSELQLNKSQNHPSILVFLSFALPVAWIPSFLSLQTLFSLCDFGKVILRLKMFSHP